MIIVDYGAGNLTSVYNALKYIGVSCKISSDPKEIDAAEKIIFPGVGAAAAAMENLNKTGIGNAIKNAFVKGVHILGICIGCQIILESSEENNNTKCLGLLQGKAIRFKDEPNLKIPHIGWNNVSIIKEHPILKGIPNNSYFYFVHSYHPITSSTVYGVSSYGTQEFPSLIGKNNLIAAQFHLEKSGEIGLTMLENFCKI